VQRAVAAEFGKRDGYPRWRICLQVQPVYPGGEGAAAIIRRRYCAVDNPGVGGNPETRYGELDRPFDSRWRIELAKMQRDHVSSGVEVDFWGSRLALEGVEPRW
jgi:hypothetical protein